MTLREQDAARANPSETESEAETGTIAVIFNPAARSTLAGFVTEEMLRSELAARGLAATVTTSPSDDAAARLAEDAARRGTAIVVAVGGDGTVHAVARGLLRAGSRAALGILPVGTMNNVARALSIPEEPAAALDLIATGRDPRNRTPLDIGVVAGEPFIEVAGVGLEAKLFPIGEAVKGHPWRLLTALGETYRIVRRFRASRVLLRVNGHRVRVRALQITLCNSPLHGPGLLLTPHARMDDGKLDLVIYEHCGGLRLLWLTLLSVGGRQVASTSLRHLQARTLTIQPGAPWPLQIDGVERGLCGRGTSRPTLEVRVEPGALAVCAPPQPALDESEVLAEGTLRTLLRAVPPPPPALAQAMKSVAETSQLAQHAVETELEPPKRAAGRLRWLRIFYIVGLAVAVVASVAARRSGILPGDLEITRAVQRQRTPLRDRIMEFVAWPGFLPQSAGIVLLPAALLWLVRLRLEASFMLLAGAQSGLNFAIKRVVKRQRPTDDLVRVARIIREPSFPSGHVMHYLSVFGFLAAAALANLRPSKLRAAILAACGALIALVGPTRIYLGAHWPSDVGAGYIFGGLYLGGLLEAYAEAKRRQAEHSEEGAS